MSPDTPGSKLDVNAVFNRSLEIYKTTAVTVWAVAIILMVPAYLVYGLLLNVNRFAAGLGNILILVAGAWLTASIVRLVQDAEATGKIDVGPGDLFKSASGKIVPVIIVELIVGIVVGILTIFCITIPLALYLAIMWSVAVPALVVEDAGIGGSLSRSKDLTEDNIWRVLWLGILIMLVFSGIGVIVALLMMISLWVALILGLVLTVLLYPLAAIIRSVLYFELLKIKGQSNPAIDTSVE